MKKNTKATGVIVVGIVFIISIFLLRAYSNQHNLTAKEDEGLLQVISSSDVIDEGNISSKLSTLGLPENPNNKIEFDLEGLEDIYFAGGSFWGLEAYMSRVVGVYDVTSGYANSNSMNPTHEEVRDVSFGYAETVHVRYDTTKVNLESLLAYYFKAIESNVLNQEDMDKNVLQRKAIFYTNYDMGIKVQRILYEEATNSNEGLDIEVAPLEHYLMAEDEQQDYLEKNSEAYSPIDLETVKEALFVYVKPEDYLTELTPIAYEVTQNNGTERAFDNPYWAIKEDGIYVDVITGQPLFSSLDQYDSGTGWPTFTKPIDDFVVEKVIDRAFGFYSVEVRSISGESHLGHIFGDGPKDQGGLRYCLNSAALKFIPFGEMAKEGYGYLEYIFE